jgi:hypothetical protein
MDKTKEKDLLLSILRLNLKKIRKQEISAEEELSAAEALKTLGLSLEDALKKASELLK